MSSNGERHPQGLFKLTAKGKLVVTAEEVNLR